MFPLRCTVRHCQQTLALRDGGLFCSAGHHFDRAREGYWSLLQPQDRRSLKAGDADSAVLARHRWLQRGHASELVVALRALLDASPLLPDARTVDLGCGEGSFGPALFADHPESYCGIDLSKRAIKLAAKSWKTATWVLANADRTLPMGDGTVDRVVSLFGRRPIDEVHRVLRSGGEYIVAVPGQEDLIELREQVQQAGHRRSRWEMIVDETRAAGFDLVQHHLWTQTIRIQPDAIADALAMTYRGARHSQQVRAEALAEMEVTLAADLLWFRVSDPPDAATDLSKASHQSIG